MLLLFLFNDPATTEIYTLSLHDALPICRSRGRRGRRRGRRFSVLAEDDEGGADLDRKSTRLNSSHSSISYAVFCLKKKTILHALTQKKPFFHSACHGDCLRSCFCFDSYS